MQHNRHAAADDVTIAGFFGGEGVMFRAAQNMRAAGGKSELQPASDNLGGQAFTAVAGQSVDQQPPAHDRRDQKLGRASGGERVWQNVEISVVAVTVNKKRN